MALNNVEMMCLAEALEVVYTAFCIRCGAELNSNNDKNDFAKEIHLKGWRVSENGDMCCPKCATSHS